MKGHGALFGLHAAADSLFHRLGIGWKYLVVVAITLPALILQQPVVALGSLAVATGCLVLTRLPTGTTLALPVGVVLLLAVLGAFQLLLQQPASAVVVPANLVTALYAARLITLTTPADVLIDALISAVRPLRRLGLDPVRFGLSVAIMLRSIPYLLGVLGDVRDSARARGLDRNPLALISPAVVRAVAYAQATGQALDARGLGGRRTEVSDTDA